MNIFEYAAENKIRFQYKGLISVEDLYDLPLKDLDGIYKALRKEEKAADEESLLATKGKDDIVLGVKIDLIKHVVNRRLEQKAAMDLAKENKAKRQRLLEIKAKRDDAALESMSDDELMKAIADLS